MIVIICTLTLPETNMAPENSPLEKEIPIGNPSFLGAMLVLGSVRTLSFHDLNNEHSSKEQPYKTPIKSHWHDVNSRFEGPSTVPLKGGIGSI